MADLWTRLWKDGELPGPLARNAISPRNGSRGCCSYTGVGCTPDGGAAYCSLFLMPKAKNCEFSPFTG